MPSGFFAINNKKAPASWPSCESEAARIARDRSPALTTAGPLPTLGRSLEAPGGDRVRRVCGARPVFYYQAKVIVVLEAVAAFESKGCQRALIHLLCPLVGLAVARGCPGVGLLD